MLGVERQVLALIKGLGWADREAIAQKMGVSPNYLDKILNGLIRDRYLYKTERGQYRLRSKAKRALAPYRGAVIASTGPL